MKLSEAKKVLEIIKDKLDYRLLDDREIAKITKAIPTSEGDRDDK